MGAAARLWGARGARSAARLWPSGARRVSPTCWLASGSHRSRQLLPPRRDAAARRDVGGVAACQFGLPAGLKCRLPSPQTAVHSPCLRALEAPSSPTRVPEGIGGSSEASCGWGAPSSDREKRRSRHFQLRGLPAALALRRVLLGCTGKPVEKAPAVGLRRVSRPLPPL